MRSVCRLCERGGSRKEENDDAVFHTLQSRHSVKDLLHRSVGGQCQIHCHGICAIRQPNANNDLNDLNSPTRRPPRFPRQKPLRNLNRIDPSQPTKITITGSTYLIERGPRNYWSLHFDQKDKPWTVRMRTRYPHADTDFCQICCLAHSF